MLNMSYPKSRKSALKAQNRLMKAIGSRTSYGEFKDLFPLGGENLISENKTDFLIKTTGTVAPKRLPMTRSMMALVQKAGKDFILQYAKSTRKPGVLFGRSLSLMGSSHLGEEQDLPVSEIGGLMFHTRPKYLRGIMLPSLEVNLIQDFNQRVDAIIDEARGKNIKTLISQPLWLEIFEERLKKKTGSGIRTNFPNLMVFCSGGVHLEPFKPRIKELLGNDIDILDNYIASEGYIAFQDNVNASDMMLLTDYGAFFEFIDLKTNERLSLEDVKINTQYEIVISNIAGLRAQPVGDIIEFTAIDPFRIKIIGRTKEFINLATEKIIAHEVTSALSSLKHNITDFTVAPNTKKGIGSYHFFIETNEDIDSNDIKEVDDYLRKNNFKYNINREEGKISSPVFHRLSPRAFEKTLRKLGKIGGQNKVPKVKNSDIFTQHLTEYIEQTWETHGS